MWTCPLIFKNTVKKRAHSAHQVDLKMATCLAFFWRTCQIPPRGLSGLWRLELVDEELEGLSVCLPPTGPVSWFLHDQALYLDSVHLPFVLAPPVGSQRASSSTETPFTGTVCSPPLCSALYACPSTSPFFSWAEMHLRSCHWHYGRDEYTRSDSAGWEISPAPFTHKGSSHICMRDVKALKRAGELVEVSIKTHREEGGLNIWHSK